MQHHLLLACLFAAIPAVEPPVFDLPRIPVPHIDGDAGEWTAAATSAIIPGAGRLHLAWCEAGLAVAAEVDDPDAVEDAVTPWAGDAVEMFLAPLPAEGIDFCQWTATPGRQGASVLRFTDRRIDVLDASTQAQALCSTRVTATGYVIEALLPWSSIRVDPKPGAVCRLQVLIDDVDVAGGKPVRHGWHPLGGAFDTPAAFHRLRLADHAVVLPGAATWQQREDGGVDVSITATDPTAPVRLKRGTKEILHGVGMVQGVLEPLSGDEPLAVEIGTDCIATIQPHPWKVPYWEGAIRHYEAQDRLAPPAPGGILFYGSSTMALWKTLAEDFPGRPVINRGFGGSTLIDALRYLDRIVIPHRPSVVVIYSGGNGIGMTTPAEVGGKMQELADRIHSVLPQTKVVLLSMKPTIKMLSRRDQMIELNQHYRAVAEGRPWLTFIDCWTPFLDSTGAPDRNLLCDDLLHPSRQGYSKLAALIAPHLPSRP